MQFKLPLQERVLKEQTVVEESGTRRLKTKEDGAMGSQILQNPSDPDATYREKEGKQNRGYTTNIVETVESMEKTEEPTVLITDGVYSGRNSGVGYYPPPKKKKTELTMDICCFIRNFQGT